MQDKIIYTISTLLNSNKKNYLDKKLVSKNV